MENVPILTDKSLNFSFEIKGISSDLFKVIRFEAQEHLSQLFSVRLQVARVQNNITREEIIDRSACLSLIENGSVQRYFFGTIAEYHQKDRGHWHQFDEILLVPECQRMTLRFGTRIFQQRSVPDIAEILFAEMGIQDYALSLRHPHEIRTYCTQYQESDWDFLTRIFAEEGIFYYFEHEAEKSTLILADDRAVLSDLAAVCTYQNLSGGMSLQPYIRQFKFSEKIAVSEIESRDYNFRHPKFNFLHQSATTQIPGDQKNQKLLSISHYDHPGRFSNEPVGKRFTKTRLESLQRDQSTGSGHSNIMPMTVGFYAKIADHPEADVNQKWCLTSLIHQGEQPQSLENEGIEGMTKYHNEFQCVPETVQWKAPIPPKPHAAGLHIAKVVGPAGEEIYCDEYGRIKVQFSWDLEGKENAASSCWIRVAQAWAGAGYGFWALPRIGHEVAVSFEQGDPDKPIVTGSLFHGENRQPAQLPAEKTKTILRTQTHKGKGFNELSFEDLNGREKIYVHAQKDVQMLVTNDQQQHIKHDLQIKIDHDMRHEVGKDAHYTVMNQRRSLIRGDDHYTAEQNLHQHIAQKYLMNVGKELHIEAGEKIVLSAGSEITVKVGNNFVKVDQAGVYLNGVGLHLMSGKAGSGTPAKPLLPNEPAPLEAEAKRISKNKFQIPYYSSHE